MRCFLSLGLAVILLSLSVDAAEPENEKSEPVFRAGAATSNITPPQGSLVVGGYET